MIWELGSHILNRIYVAFFSFFLENIVAFTSTGFLSLDISPENLGWFLVVSVAFEIPVIVAFENNMVEFNDSPEFCQGIRWGVVLNRFIHNSKKETWLSNH